MTSLGLFSLPTRIFTWWIQELTACVPAALRDLFQPARKTLLVEVEGDGARLSFAKGGAAQDVGRIGPGEDGRAAGRLLRGVDIKGSEVVLLLPPHQVLRRAVDLPLAAAENLREVLSFEMDRHTPLRPEEVYFDYRVLRTDAEDKRLSVDLAVVRRMAVDQAMTRVRGWGLTVDAVGVAGEAATDPRRLNFLAGASAGPARRGAQPVVVALLLIAFALLAAVVYVPLRGKQATLSEIQARLQQVQAEAGAADKLRQQLVDTLQRSGFLIEKRRNQPTVIQLLDEVTQLLADDTFLVRFRVSGDQIQLSGYATKASALIADLEASDMLSGVSFSSPVTLDPRVGKERFDLTAKLESSPETAP